MSVVIETTVGDLTVDLYTKVRFNIVVNSLYTIFCPPPAPLLSILYMHLIFNTGIKWLMWPQRSAP